MAVSGNTASQMRRCLNDGSGSIVLPYQVEGRSKLMNSSIRYGLALLSVGAVSAFVACSSVGNSALPGAPAGGGGQGQSLSSGSRLIGPGPAVHVCGPAAPGTARCHALRRTDIGSVGLSLTPLVKPSHSPHPTPTPTPSSTPAPTPTPTPTGGGGGGLTCPGPASPGGGFAPCDLHTAYTLPTDATTGSGQTVAIVDAFDDPSAESDLGVYRSQFGLAACTTANGCFRKTDQNGGTSYPRGDTGWAQEISLDVDMASAICPNCHILLVEAASNSFANLATAVDYAATQAGQVSNSYGANESSTADSYASHYYHPNHVITVSSGDNGYSAGPQFPADVNTVTAVGGTTLSSTSGPVESVWSGAGSGCSNGSSSYVQKQSWQTDAGCSERTIADVAAVADPNTGVAVYDTYGASGWLVFGGTSVASPIIASVYALAGNASNSAVWNGSYPYSHTGSLHDIKSGSNGSCGGSYLCTAVTGYDGPTGNGTPSGLGAF